MPILKLAQGAGGLDDHHVARNRAPHRVVGEAVIERVADQFGESRVLAGLRLQCQRESGQELRVVTGADDREVALQTPRDLNGGVLVAVVPGFDVLDGVAAQRGQWRGRDHSADLARGVLHLVERIARLENGVHLHFITPGRPMENGYIESFNGKFRDECLNENWFFDLADARRKIAEWKADYNHVRPHSALGYKTPFVR